ncbi:MAG: ATP-binding cassette domain-containing protein [Xenococcus sp. MO_188.B8]|nr:ATP-binding cassette domain-containing protein [Xenococcus sp. MO_188.B8]
MNGADPKTKASKIQKLVADGDLDEATKQLIDFAEDFSFKRELKRESVAIAGQYVSLSEEKRIYGLTEFTYNKINQLRDHVLQLLDHIVDEFNQTNIDVYKKETVDSLQTDSHPQTNEKFPGKIEEEDEKINRYELAKEIWELIQIIPPTSIVFEGTGISKTYKSKAISFTLHPLDLSLKLGEITAVVGENGHGKTTLLRIVAGDLLSSTGELKYPYLTLNGKTDWYSIKQQTAYIPQALPWWRGLLLENLNFAASIHGITRQDNEDIVNRIVTRLRLDEYRKATWHEISSGYRTRFALAKALICKPKLVILDEPLGNLDINTQGVFLRDLKNLTNSSANPISILVSSQHLYQLESIADNIIFLKDGQAMYSGSVKDFGKNRNVNSYEIACDLSKEELVDLLQSINCIRIEEVGMNFIVNIPREVTTNQLLSIFAEHNISLKYFRDISQSTRKLFEF